MSRNDLLKAIAVTAEIYGRHVSENAARVFMMELEGYPEHAVLAALSRCRKELRQFPSIADIIIRIDDGRPGADEAWAMLPKSEDESVVWTEEMAEAYGLVHDLIHKDQTAARMAFREAYSKLLADVRANQVPVKWTASLGQDPGRRERVLKDAVQRGRLSQEQAQDLIPDYTSRAQKAPAQLEATSEPTRLDPKTMVALIRDRIGLEDKR